MHAFVLLLCYFESILNYCDYFHSYVSFLSSFATISCRSASLCSSFSFKSSVVGVMSIWILTQFLVILTLYITIVDFNQRIKM